jgi:hypothetical protein
MKLLIKIPTRERKEKFFKLLDTCIEKLTVGADYHFLISCDDDDEAMLNEWDRLDKYENLSYFFSPRDSKIGACNRDIDKISYDWDIVVLISDDMMPMVDMFDLYITENMEERFPDTDGVLWFYDGHREDINTVSILGKKYYDRFGWIYYPKYRSFYCDNEHTIVAERLGKQQKCNWPMTLIEHQHYSFEDSFTNLPKHVKKENPLHGADSIQIHNRPDLELDARTFLNRGKDNYGL